MISGSRAALAMMVVPWEHTEAGITFSRGPHAGEAEGDIGALDAPLWGPAVQAAAGLLDLYPQLFRASMCRSMGRGPVRSLRGK